MTLHANSTIKIELLINNTKKKEIEIKLMKPIIGIDIGTSTSCTAIMYQNKVDLIPDNATGERIIPSIECLTHMPFRSFRLFCFTCRPLFVQGQLQLCTPAQSHRLRRRAGCSARTPQGCRTGRDALAEATVLPVGSRRGCLSGSRPGEDRPRHFAHRGNETAVRTPQPPATATLRMRKIPLCVSQVIVLLSLRNMLALEESDSNQSIVVLLQ